jgi:hypothetical protein
MYCSCRNVAAAVDANPLETSECQTPIGTAKFFFVAWTLQTSFTY